MNHKRGFTVNKVPNHHEPIPLVIMLENVSRHVVHGGITNCLQVVRIEKSNRNRNVNKIQGAEWTFKNTDPRGSQQVLTINLLYLSVYRMCLGKNILH